MFPICQWNQLERKPRFSLVPYSYITTEKWIKGWHTFLQLFFQMLYDSIL